VLATVTVTEKEKEKVTARLGVAVRLFAQTEPQESTKGTERTKGFAKSFVPFVVLCGTKRISFILFGGSFAFLFLGKPLLIFLQPDFEIAGCFFEFVTVQQTAAKRFEERARTNVVSEFFISFLVRAVGDRHEEFFVERSEAAFDATQAQRTLPGDGPV
jgi:hypothetical protein